MSLHDVMLEELRSLYSAENQIVKALPKLIKHAKNEELKNGFSQHLAQTEEHVERLKKIFEQLDQKPTGKDCKGMEGLLEEGKEVLNEDENGDSYDVGLIGAASRVEHYEIAGYTWAITVATALGMKEAVALLEETLAEEEETRDELEDLLSQFLERSVKRTAA
uniref:Ferritin-like domain-containing protein n=1 Tax=Acidobacterium capsulatum TaxID=33075 RepID=A0A7V4XTK5_9BACT